MSRLILLSSLTALALLGSGASGLALAPNGSLGEQEPAELSPRQEVVAPQPLPEVRASFTAAGTRLRLAPAESLTGVLIRGGAGGLDAALADRALEGSALAPGRPLRLWLGSALPGGARRIDRLEARGADGKTLVLTRTDERFVLERKRVAIDDTPVRLRLTAGPSLEARLVAAKLPVELRRQVLILAQPLDLVALDLLIAHEEEAGRGEYGELLYLALTLADGEVRRWLGNEEGVLERIGGTDIAGGLLRPVPGPVSSSMGLRLHPILRFLRWHRGTDFAAPAGTPVRAAASGRVVEAGWRGGYGRLIRVAHEDGTVSAYAHLARIDALAGERVTQGTTIGLVGASGLATGPHLHFEWLRKGQPLRPVFKPTSPSTRALDEATIAALRSLLTAPYREPPRAIS